MKTLRDLGECEVIRRLASTLPSRSDVRVGIGDDTAVVEVEGTEWDFLLTTDAVVEGTHFLPRTDPRLIGRKAVGRVLSDFAAMGGEPLWVLMDVVADGSTPYRRLREVYDGARRLAGKYGMAIVGGDMTSGPCLELHAFGVGRVPRGAAVLRSGARPGDLVYVTGVLGGSRSGKHLEFEPRLQEGLWLREAGWVSAMIDLSDGLAADLRHLLERSRVGAVLDVERVPVSAAARKARDGRSPLEHALCDGEDFELLFTVPAEKRGAFESSWAEAFRLPVTFVGRITSRRGKLDLPGVNGRTGRAPMRGYEHFRR
jgi:thiamine-monophosphate kinase